MTMNAIERGKDRVISNALRTLFPESRISRSSRRGSKYALFSVLVLAALDLLRAPLAIAQVSPINVTTQQNDIGRTGQNLNETILTTDNVNSTQFGLVFSQPVSGAVVAQPLYLSGITINGTAHNAVFVSTSTGYVYAFDANSNTGSNSSPLWKISLFDTSHGASPGATNYSNPGSTPVIDPIGNTLYVVSSSFESGAPIFRLHALDVTSGQEKFGGPVVIAPSVPGTAADSNGLVVPLTTRNHKSRTGLLLLNGVVYVSFGSQVEGYEATWHGWIAAYDATSLAQTGAFCSTPNGQGGGIWMSGNGLAADQLDPVNHAFGRMFVPTGNGDFNATTPYSNNMDFGDSVVNLDLTNGNPTVTDDFTPFNQALFFAKDTDQGSGGVLVLPTQAAGSYPHLLVQAGKSGTIYLLNRESLGGYNPTDQVVQALPNAVGNAGAWSSPAYWNGSIYYGGQNDYLKSFPLVNGLLSDAPMQSVELIGYPGATPSISANGNTQGIVWTIDAHAQNAGGPAILEAHDASNVATTLYSSASNPARDTPGPATYFVVPAIANGMVYVGTVSQIDVYGLLSSAQTSTPIITSSGQAFVGSVTVTITDATPNAAIYYTTDGSAATTASALYTGSIVVSSSGTINAVAVAPGLAMSNQAWASYTQLHTALPTFPTAALAYSSPQPVTISDATSGATIYYTIDGSNPTLNSTVYSGPITVSASETIKAVAIAPGYLISGIAAAAYAIVSAPTVLVNYPAGFTSTAALSLVGGTTVSSDSLQLMGSAGTSSAVWYKTPVNIQTFSTDFYFSIQETTHFADGFTFTLQNAAAGLQAVGGASGGLGYQGIGSSVAVKFDVYDNAGEGYNSTGFYTNGAAPTMPAVDMGSTVNLLGPNLLHANLTYDGFTLTLTLADTVSGAQFTASTAINIPAIVGANTAYAGFTAGTHGSGASLTISNWTYVGTPTSPSATAAPGFTPAAGTYPAAQPVTITDATNGALIYYTTNGSTPSKSSTAYSGPITVTADETLKAIAAASGYTSSAVAVAAYKIRAAPPSFTPAAGTYPAAQSVAITDGTSGALIYYTTDGSTPTTSSEQYSGPISVTADETLKAIAAASGYANTAVATAAYKIHAATPSFTPAGGVYRAAQSVTITDGTRGALIYYTTDGSTPTTSSEQYSGPISVTANETLKAIAAASGYTASAVGHAAYTIK
jgi:hypothetical protein